MEAIWVIISTVIAPKCKYNDVNIFGNVKKDPLFLSNVYVYPSFSMTLCTFSGHLIDVIFIFCVGSTSSLYIQGEHSYLIFVTVRDLYGLYMNMCVECFGYSSRGMSNLSLFIHFQEKSATWRHQPTLQTLITAKNATLVKPIEAP